MWPLANYQTLLYVTPQYTGILCTALLLWSHDILMSESSSSGLHQWCHSTEEHKRASMLFYFQKELCYIYANILVLDKWTWFVFLDDWSK